MQNEIKGMSAEEILEEFNNLFPDSSPPTYDQEEHKDWLRNALAAYTKFLLEGFPIIGQSGLSAPANQQAWELGVDDCRSFLQDQIDQLSHQKKL